MDEDAQDGETKCPYCERTDECVHLILVVDVTFRHAEGGLLYEAFNSRWGDLCEQGGDDFDEREPFDNLLEEIDSMADANSSADFDGGPGMSSAYSYYYARTAERAQKAVRRFGSVSE